MLSGCKDEYKPDIEKASYLDIVEEWVSFNLSEKAEGTVASALNGGEWTDYLPRCGYDYEFLVDGSSVTYNTDCGTFTDTDKNLSKRLSYKKKLKLNEVLEKSSAQYGSKREYGDEYSIRVLEYELFHPHGNRVSEKSITPSEISYEIIQTLKSLNETEKIEPKISDDEISIGRCDLSVERGTSWMEIGSSIYRISSDHKRIVKVDKHFGEGVVLEESGRIEKLMDIALNGYQCDKYYGVYDDRHGEFEYKQTYRGDSSVHIHIKNITRDYSEKCDNKVTVELFSDIDQKVDVHTLSMKSVDNLFGGDSEIVKLRAGIPKEAEIDFGGCFNTSFYLDVYSDKTYIHIKILP